MAALVDVGRRDVDRAAGRPAETGALAERFDGNVRVSFRPDSTLALEAAALYLDERQRWPTGPLFDFADNTQVSARSRRRLASRAVIACAPRCTSRDFDHLARRGNTPLPIAGTGDRQNQRLDRGRAALRRPGARPGTGRRGRAPAGADQLDGRADRGRHPHPVFGGAVRAAGVVDGALELRARRAAQLERAVGLGVHPAARGALPGERRALDPRGGRPWLPLAGLQGAVPPVHQRRRRVCGLRQLRLAPGAFDEPHRRTSSGPAPASMGGRRCSGTTSRISSRPAPSPTTAARCSSSATPT